MADWGRSVDGDPTTRNLYDDDCSVTAFWLPVAMQWNFYLTPVISVFGEPGFAIAPRRWSWNRGCAPMGAPASFCDYDFDDTDLEFVLWARHAPSCSVTTSASTVRIGYPMVTAGINFLL